MLNYFLANLIEDNAWANAPFYPQRQSKETPCGDSFVFDRHVDGTVFVHVKLSWASESERVRIQTSGHPSPVATHGKGDSFTALNRDCVLIADPVEFSYVSSDQSRIEIARVAHYDAFPGGVGIARPTERGAYVNVLFIIRTGIADDLRVECGSAVPHLCCSNWLLIKSFSDIWKYILVANIYVHLPASNADRRFPSQQCAYALFRYLLAISRVRRSSFLKALALEIAYLVAERMHTCGYMEHNLWSPSGEVHGRFQYDAISLLCDAANISTHPIFRLTASAAAEYVDKYLIDFNPNFCWFLHDTREFDSQPYKFRSAIFGQSAGNSITLNTHAQALVSLRRFLETGSMPSLANKVQLGLISLRRVLGKCFSNYFREVDEQARQSEWVWESDSSAHPLKRKIDWEMHVLEAKRASGCMVWPTGMIERDLTLSVRHIKYHVINTKDILILCRQVSDENFRMEMLSVLRQAMAAIGELNPARSIDSSPYFLEVLDCIVHARENGLGQYKEIEYEWVSEIEARNCGFPLDWSVSNMLRDISR